MGWVNFLNVGIGWKKVLVFQLKKVLFVLQITNISLYCSEHRYSFVQIAIDFIFTRFMSSLLISDKLVHQHRLQKGY